MTAIILNATVFSAGGFVSSYLGALQRHDLADALGTIHHEGTFAAADIASTDFKSRAISWVIAGGVVAALVGLWAVRLAARPPDLAHHFGHGKAEYLSAAVEGGLIFVAAAAIVWTSVPRLFDPVPIEQAGIGLGLSTIAAVVNLIVGAILVRAGRRSRSIAVEADGRHLLPDVVTSVVGSMVSRNFVIASDGDTGVVVGVGFAEGSSVACLACCFSLHHSQTSLLLRIAADSVAPSTRATFALSGATLMRVDPVLLPVNSSRDTPSAGSNSADTINSCVPASSNFAENCRVYA